MSVARKWENSTFDREYNSWRAMRSRCLNARHPSFSNYGGRGINICDEWINNYDAFVRDMGPRPEGATLERINTNGDYEPGNCRWATAKEQLNNQRRCRKYTLNGETLTVTQWAERVGVRPDAMFRRIDHYGISPEIALVSPDLKSGWRHGTRQGYEKHKCKCVECRAANTARHRDRRARIACD
jgi:hypothetical protein